MDGPNSRSLPSGLRRRRILAGAFAIGFSCVITQLILMREMLAVFAGNELVLGIVLGNWLLLMGLGAALGRWPAARQNPLRLLSGLLVCTALLPALQVMVVRGLRHVVFLRGVAIGTVATVLTSLLVLLPYCLLAGLFLTLACRGVALQGDDHGAGRIYVMDGAGSVAGGALFSFALVLWLDHFAILCAPAILSLLVAAWMVWPAGATPNRAIRVTTACARFLGPAAILVVAVVFLVWIWRANPDRATTALQFPAQELLFSGYSPYGRLAVTQSGGQTNFYENGLLMAATPNIESAEEAVHYAMAQRPGAKRVLLIGGLLSGAARELLRYDVGQVDCVELDPLIARIGRDFLLEELDHPRLNVVAVDARQFIRRSRERFDIVIIALPDPATAQLNRFFSSEFFQETRRVLNPGGVFCFAVGRYENYAGPELVQMLSSARRTAGLWFAHLLLIPGGRVYFLASDGPLTLGITGELERARVKPRWVTAHYLEAALAEDRLADLDRVSTQAAPPNRDFRPVLYFLLLRHWDSQFQRVSGWVTFLVLVAMGIYVFRLRGAASAIFASGFAGASLEMVLLLGMQVLVGAVYRQMGLVVTVFMAGLAAGALGATRWLERLRPTVEGDAPQTPSMGAGSLGGSPHRLLLLLALTVAVSALVLPPFLLVLGRLVILSFGDILAQILIVLFTFSLAVVAGAQFPVANALAADARDPAVRLYTADFMGAALGALLTSALLLPLIGVTGTCAIAAGLNVLAALMVFRKGTFA